MENILGVFALPNQHEIDEKITPCGYPNIMVKPEQTAPDFETEAYYKGKLVNVRLRDFNKQWVLLFFYASDFTFV